MVSDIYTFITNANCTLSNQVNTLRFCILKWVFMVIFVIVLQKCTFLNYGDFFEIKEITIKNVSNIKTNLYCIDI